MRYSQFVINVGTKLLTNNASGEKIETFSANSAKSYIGKNVNLHLKDGAVIINVQLTGLLKISSKNNIVEYTTFVNHKTNRIPLRNVAWAEQLNSIFLQKAA